MLDPKHLGTLQLLTEIYFDREDYRYAYEYARRAVSLADEIDLKLRPYIGMVKECLSSSKLMSIPARTVTRSIDEEEKAEKDWGTWALEFMAWYESTRRQA